MKHVVFCLYKLNSWNNKKSFFRFPDDPVKIKYTKLTVESVRGSRNNRYEWNKDRGTVFIIRRDQWDRSNSVRKVGRKLDVSTPLTPGLHLLWHNTCCVFTSWVVWNRSTICSTTHHGPTLSRMDGTCANVITKDIKNNPFTFVLGHFRRDSRIFYFILNQESER
jgi:hypothetical protein